MSRGNRAWPVPLRNGDVVTHHAGDGTLMTVVGGDETLAHCRWLEDAELRDQMHLPGSLLIVVAFDE